MTAVAPPSNSVALPLHPRGRPHMQQSRLVAEMQLPMPLREPRHHPAHRDWIAVDLAEIPDLARSPILGNRHRIPGLRNVQPNENFAILFHGSSPALRIGSPHASNPRERSMGRATQSADGHAVLRGSAPEPRESNRLSLNSPPELAAASVPTPRAHQFPRRGIRSSLPGRGDKYPALPLAANMTAHSDVGEFGAPYANMRRAPPNREDNHGVGRHDGLNQVGDR